MIMIASHTQRRHWSKARIRTGKLHRTRVALRPTRRAWRWARTRLHPGNLRFVRPPSTPPRARATRKAPTLTFNQKVRYKMLADHRPLLTTLADKLAVRGAYVESTSSVELSAVLVCRYSRTEDAGAGRASA